MTAGTRLGPYEVTTQFGVGGMGEVYRATDTNLGRQVSRSKSSLTPSHDPERLFMELRNVPTEAKTTNGPIVREGPHVVDGSADIEFTLRVLSVRQKDDLVEFLKSL